MTWVITGLFYGLFMSFYTYINQKYKLNGYILGMWRGFGIMLVTFPIIFVEPFYFDPIYFILLTVQGLFIGYFDSRVFMASARFGAGGTSRTLVFSIVISTILWWILHPADFWFCGKDLGFCSELLQLCPGRLSVICPLRKIRFQSN